MFDPYRAIVFPIGAVMVSQYIDDVLTLLYGRIGVDVDTDEIWGPEHWPLGLLN